MNRQDSLKRFDLKTVAAASFDWAGHRYTVRQAPSSIFDTWVRQYVETIEDVDTEAWDIFDRWGIVKALLQGNFLTLAQEGGTSVLKGRAEEKSSTPETEEEGSITPAELQTSIRGKPGVIDIPGAPTISGLANLLMGVLSGDITTDAHPLEPLPAPSSHVRQYPDLEGE